MLKTRETEFSLQPSISLLPTLEESGLPTVNQEMASRDVYTFLMNDFILQVYYYNANRTLLTHSMISESIEVFHQNLLEHVQISNDNPWTPS